MDIQFSKFLKTLEKKKQTLVFHTLHPDPIFINTEKWTRFKKNPKDSNLIAQLKKRGLVIGSDEEDDTKLRKTRKQYGKKIKQVTTLYLVLTHKCNLECKYCFVRRSFNKEERETMMTIETAKKGIDIWVKHLKRNSKNGRYFIIFYGGEPLLNLSTFKFSLEYIKLLKKESKIPKNVKKILITNGTLIKPDIVDLLKSHNVDVTVSIDGPKRINDICRIDNNKKGIFDRVKKSMNLLQSKKVNTYISTTITPYNLNKLKMIPNLVKKWGAKEFSLNMLMGKTLSFLNSRMTSRQYINKSSNEIIKAFLSAKKKKVYEDRLGSRIDAFIKDKFYPIDCRAYGGQIVIQPDGYISNCHASRRYNIKHINACNNFRIWNASSINKWKKRLPLFNKKCLNCEAISICGGGCPWSTEEVGGDLMKKDNSSCVFTKKAFKFIVWNYYKE